MLNKSIGVLINNRLNRYKLVLDVAQKAREISNTAKDNGEILVEKPVTLAIDEMAAEYNNSEN